VANLAAGGLQSGKPNAKDSNGSRRSRHRGSGRGPRVLLLWSERGAAGLSARKAPVASLLSLEQRHGGALETHTAWCQAVPVSQAMNLTVKEVRSGCGGMRWAAGP